jgi:hypothetical protein
MARIRIAGWMVWDRDTRAPAEVFGRQLVKFDKVSAELVRDKLNTERVLNSNKKMLMTAPEPERMIRAETATRFSGNLSISVLPAEESWRAVAELGGAGQQWHCRTEVHRIVTRLRSNSIWTGRWTNSLVDVQAKSLKRSVIDRIRRLGAFLLH